MKAQAKTTDFLCILFVLLILFSYFTFIFPIFVKDVVTEVAKSSAEVVARQASGLITLVGASLADETKLSHKFAEDVKYDVGIKERVLAVFPHFKTTFAEKTSASVLLGVELGEHEFKEVSGLVVSKLLKDTGDKSFTILTNDTNFVYKVGEYG